MLTAEKPPPAIVGHVKSYREPDDICHACEAFWKEKGKSPRILVELPGRTDYGHRVYVCPHCDGPVAERVGP